MPRKLDEMFDRFSDHSRKAMTGGWRQALDWGHGYVGTEHVLKGLLGTRSVAADVLVKMGVDLDALAQAVDARVSPGTSPADERPLPFTPRMKQALECALEESRSLGHDYIGTEHVLLGLFGEGVAGAALAEAGVGVEAVRAAIPCSPE